LPAGGADAELGRTISHFGNLGCNRAMAFSLIRVPRKSRNLRLTQVREF
jgi:hypothetical protein